MRMKVMIEVSDKFLSDLVQSGIDSGIRYWCAGIKPVRGAAGLVIGGTVTVNAEGGPSMEGLRYKLDFKRAVQLAAAKYPRVLDESKMDSEKGDMFIQLAAFGKLVFG
jgi:hypothetical protein